MASYQAVRTVRAGREREKQEHEKGHHQVSFDQSAVRPMEQCGGEEENAEADPQSDPRTGCLLRQRTFDPPLDESGQHDEPYSKVSREEKCMDIVVDRGPNDFQVSGCFVSA